MCNLGVPAAVALAVAFGSCGKGGYARGFGLGDCCYDQPCQYRYNDCCRDYGRYDYPGCGCNADRYCGCNVGRYCGC